MTYPIDQTALFHIKQKLQTIQEDLWQLQKMIEIDQGIRQERKFKQEYCQREDARQAALLEKMSNTLFI